MKDDKIICGIYKITNPKNQVYIGKSTDIKRRFKDYRYSKLQGKINKSLTNFGIKNHKFEIIHQCDSNQLSKLEQYYINLYQSTDINNGLNINNVAERISIQFKVEDELRREFATISKITSVKLERLYKEALRYGLETLKSIHKS